MSHHPTLLERLWADVGRAESMASRYADRGNYSHANNRRQFAQGVRHAHDVASAYANADGHVTIGATGDEWDAMAEYVLPRNVVAGAFHMEAVRNRKRWEAVHGYWSVPCPYCGATPPCR
jgi:hypothetical protein